MGWLLTYKYLFNIHTKKTNSNLHQTTTLPIGYVESQGPTNYD